MDSRWEVIVAALAAAAGLFLRWMDKRGQRQASEERAGMARGAITAGLQGPALLQLPALESALGPLLRHGTLANSITSAYRTPEHNAEVGGSPTSLHLQGLALDISTTDNKAARDALARAARDGRLVNVREIISYEKTVHVHIAFQPGRSAPPAVSHDNGDGTHTRIA